MKLSFGLSPLSEEEMYKYSENTLSVLQPELFEDINFNEEMKDFYNNFYDFQLTDEDMEQI